MITAIEINERPNVIVHSGDTYKFYKGPIKLFDVCKLYLYWQSQGFEIDAAKLYNAGSIYISNEFVIDLTIFYVNRFFT